MAANFIKSLLHGSQQGTSNRQQAAGSRQEQERQDRNEMTISQLKKVYHFYQQNARKFESPPTLQDREKDLGRAVPLFCNAFGSSPGSMITKFTDVHDFAEDISSLFVSLVSDKAQSLQGLSEDAGLMYYLCEEKKKFKIAFKILQAITILCDSQESVVQRLLQSPLIATLVNCTRIFIDPPPPRVVRTTSVSQSTPTDEVAPVVTIPRVSDDQKETICKLFHSILTKCSKFCCALSDILSGDVLSYLFSCSTTAPCITERLRWRKLSSDVLIHISRYNMTPELIELVQRRGILRLSLHNLTTHTKASREETTRSERYVSPLEVVDLFVPVFCWLKDSCEYNPSLLSEFGKCYGYNFLYEFLIEMDRRDSEDDPVKVGEAHDATHQMMNVIYTLCFQGYFDLHPNITEPGPYQDKNFQVPIPAGGGQSVKNKDSFQILERVFINCKSVFMGVEVVDTMHRVLVSDHANYFIIDQLHTLPHLIDDLPLKRTAVQEKVFAILEFVVCTLNYIPSAELANLSLLLQNHTEHMKLAVLVLNNLIKLSVSNVSCKEVFREVGVVLILMNCLKERTALLAQDEKGQALAVSVVEAIQQPPPPSTVSELHDQFFLLLAECMRVMLQGNNENVAFFRNSNGFKYIAEMLPYGHTRRLALGLLSVLLTSEDGVTEMFQILDYMNGKPSNAIGLKYDLLKTILKTFDMEVKVKSIFREANGFQYLISYMSKLDGSLSPVRTSEWTLVDRLEILEYVKLILLTIATALRGNPANVKHFQENIRFESFSEPLRYLGCFAYPMVTLEEDCCILGEQDKEFLHFNAEFVTHQPPTKHLHPNSCVYAAAHVFQYLRDMSVEVKESGVSLSPILPDTFEEVSQLHQFTAPSKDSVPVITHPGPLLCMVDLLPGVHPSVVELNVAEWTLSGGHQPNPASSSSLLEQPPLARVKKNSYENFSPSKSGSLSLDSSPKVPAKEYRISADTVDMPREVLKYWCLYLQERIASEIYHLVTLTQNQQTLCQAGLPGRLIQCCAVALANEEHPLHQPLQRTFEKLSYQSMTSADLRNFLRLGGPLFCKYNEVVESDQFIKVNKQIPFDLNDLAVNPDDNSLVSFEDYNPDDEDYKLNSEEFNAKSFGGSLSLTRIQSLVSMTTPRGVAGKLISPSFVDFNLSRDGFGYLFLPSVFPQAAQLSSQPGPPSVGGIGFGERVFPPPNGLTFSTWICIVKHDFPVNYEKKKPETPRGDSSPKREDPKFADLFTLYQSVEGAEMKKKRSFSCLTIALSLKDHKLIVSTQAHSLKGTRRNRVDIEEHTLTGKHSKDRIKEAEFDCSCLFEESKWYHLAILIHRNVIRGANASLYLNGEIVSTQKVTYIQPVVHASSLSAKEAHVPMCVSVNGIVGTHSSLRHCLAICYSLGPTYLFEEPIHASSIRLIYQLGSTYMGCFQAPMKKDNSIAAVHLGSQTVLGPIVPEDKIVFGIVANVEKTTSMVQLDKEITSVDIKAVAKETRLKRDNSTDPVKYMPNIAVHLSGPARSPGAVIVGNTGVRTFSPMCISTLLSSVGGTNVMLGLVAMATTAECLYASVKALVCSVGGNTVALRDMERSGGFKILGMFLRSKSSLLNGNILHLVLSLVGTLDSEHECTQIPYPQAFKDLLADLSVWSEASQDILRSLLQHFRDLLSAGFNDHVNAQMMTDMGLVSIMLHLLQDSTLEEKTKMDICDTLSVLFRGCLIEQDLRRLGQFMVNTLPEKEEGFNENSFPVYELMEELKKDEEAEPVAKQPLKRSKSCALSDDATVIRTIRLRNILLGLLEELLPVSEANFEEFLATFHSILGFDWLLLFLQPHIHRETVARGLRVLVHILSSPVMYAKFRDGDLAGHWLEGAEEFLVDLSLGSASTEGDSRFYTLMSPKSGHFQHVKNISEMTNEMKGFQLLSFLLPHHTRASQSFMYIVALLLGRPISEVPYGTEFNSESLMKMVENCKSSTGRVSLSLSQSLSGSKKAQHPSLKFEAVQVLLSFLGHILHDGHSPGSGNEIQALTLVTFLRKLYSHSSFPNFVAYAQTPEFIEQLVMSLFAPPSLKNYGNLLQSDDLGFVVVETEEIQTPPALLQADKDHADVYSVIQLLVTIAMDSLSHVVSFRNGPPHCPILDSVLEAASFTSLLIQHEYQTILLNAIMDHIVSGAETPADLFYDSKSVARSLQGFVIFCHKVVTCLWKGIYKRPSNSIYTFLRNVLELAKANASVYNIPELQRALNRVILFQLSSSAATNEEKTNVVDTLCIVSSQVKEIFDVWNTDPEFLQCVVYRLLDLVCGGDGEGGDSQAAFIPSAQRNLHNAANRLWVKLLGHRKEVLQELLHTDLPDTTCTTPTGGDGPILGTSPSLNRGSSSPSLNRQKRHKLQNCRDLKSEHLTRLWENYSAAEKHGEPQPTHTLQKSRSQKKSSKRVVEVRVDKSREYWLVEEYVLVHTAELVKAIHSLERMLQKKYKRNCDYTRRFTASEWSHIVYQLTRERGLWGPEKPCFLDKWMLDTAEGPARMRRRMCRNPKFFHDYPFMMREVLNVEFDGRTKPPRSLHSVYQHCRQQLFKETSHLSMPVMQVHSQVLGGSELAIDYGIEPSGVPEEDVAPLTTGVDAEEASLGPGDEADDPVTQAVLRMLEQDEKIMTTHQYKCARLYGLDARDGVFLFGVSHFYVIEGITLLENGGYIDIASIKEGDYVPVVPKELRSHMHISSLHPPIKCIKWSYYNIKEIHKRRYVLRECALEIFSDDGRNNLLIFEKHKMPAVLQKLESMTVVFQTAQTELVAGIKPSGNVEEGPSRFPWFSSEKPLAQKWENGEISNFQYLMHLNTLAGRTYSDLMQYPIFPWVLADYESEILDLSDPKTFRDLSKPMGAQTEERMKYYQGKYKEEAWEPTFTEPEHFHYRIHYCSAMTVASYLIRMEPYTQYFINLQDGHFDRADRAFNSIEMAWRSASGEDRNDIRELIPEFFYLPEFLTNANQFLLGCKQNGTVIGDVILPPWAKGDPREFIRIQREALECDYVSAHLHEWIDLIFGYKQSGPAAVDACNMFHPYFYEQNVRDIDKLDAADRGAALSIIHHFGQMPKQILTKPHRQKRVPLVSTPTSDFALSSSSTSSKLFYRDIASLEQNELNLKVRNEVGQIISDKTVLATERYKILIPPKYTKYFAWHYDDHSARICAVDQDKTLGVFEGLHTGQIMCAAAVNAKTLITGGESTVVCVWDVRRGGREKGKRSVQLKKLLYGHTNVVLCVGVSKAFQIIVSGSADSTCIIWDLNKLSFIQQLCPNSGSITALAINSQTGDIVSCTRTSVHLWTINGQLLVSTSIAQRAYSSITCCAMSELIPYDKDNVIVIGCSDGRVRILSMVYDSDLKKRKEHSRRSESEDDLSKPGQGNVLRTPKSHTIDEAVALTFQTVTSPDEDEVNDDAAYISTRSFSPKRDSRSSNNLSEAGEDKKCQPIRINVENWDAHKTRKQSLNLCLLSTLTPHSSATDKSSPHAKVTSLCISKDHRKLYVGDSLGRVYSWTAGEPG